MKATTTPVPVAMVSLWVYAWTTG